MAPTIGRVALDNGFHGSIPGDWVAPPPQNIQFEDDEYLNLQLNAIRTSLRPFAKEIKMKEENL